VKPRQKQKAGRQRAVKRRRRRRKAIPLRTTNGLKEVVGEREAEAPPMNPVPEGKAEPQLDFHIHQCKQSGRSKKSSWYRPANQGAANPRNVEKKRNHRVPKKWHPLHRQLNLLPLQRSQLAPLKENRKKQHHLLRLLSLRSLPRKNRANR
jgi:hypothetical protein